MFKILNVNSNTFDIFWGKGWNNWCRVNKKGHRLVKVAGESVPDDVWHSVYKEIK